MVEMLKEDQLYRSEISSSVILPKSNKTYLTRFECKSIIKALNIEYILKTFSGITLKNIYIHMRRQLGEEGAWGLGFPLNLHYGLQLVTLILMSG